MEKFGFKELSTVEHRLLQNVNYFNRLKRKVVILLIIFIISLLLFLSFSLSSSTFKMQSSQTLLRSCQSFLLIFIIICPFFIFLLVRNGRYVYLTCSYKNRVNKILKQFSLQLRNDTKCRIEFDHSKDGMSNINYNYCLFKSESKTRNN